MKSNNPPLEKVFALIPGHVYWKDCDGNYLGCNANQLATLGLSSTDEIIGKSDFDFYDAEYAQQLQDIDKSVIAEKRTITIAEPIIDENGNETYFLSKKTPLIDEGGEIIGVLGSTFDLTGEKKVTEEVLRLKAQAETTLENIINLIPGHVYWKDTEFKYLGCNSLQAESLNLSSATDIVGKTDFDLARKKVADELRRIDEKVLNSDTLIEAEETIEKGGKQIVMLSRKVPMHDHDGDKIGILGISIDITARKKAEELERQLLIEKLESIKAMAAAIAHELRTPIRSIDLQLLGITNNLPVLLDAYMQAEKANLKIEPISNVVLEGLNDLPKTVSNEVKSAFTVINMLLANAKYLDTSTIQKQTCSIQQCIQKAVESYPFDLGEQELLHWDENTDFEFQGDPLLTTHIFLNLMRNAFYFIKAAQKGEITITIKKTKTEHVVYFEDTSTGIAPDNLPHIFDQFFSKRRHGTGVGLAFCKTIMEATGGSITCESTPREYTRFTLTFPT